MQLADHAEHPLRSPAGGIGLLLLLCFHAASALTSNAASALRERFSESLARDRVITYCGGGIAATSDAFVLTGLLGHPDVGVYDGSMSEWVQDPDAPLEV